MMSNILLCINYQVTAKSKPKFISDWNLERPPTRGEEGQDTFGSVTWVSC
jgi:hypothetical protein